MSKFNILAFSVVLAGLGGCAGNDSSGPVGTDDSQQAESAEALIDRSIMFHDPQDLWTTGVFRVLQKASRPDGSSRNDQITFGRGGSSFRLVSERQGRPFELGVVNDVVSLTIDGVAPSAALAKELRLDDAGSLRMRNYYAYLYGLPMKLKDPGTLIDPLPKMADLNGRETLEIRVAYDAEVGSDIWYFNFDPATAEMLGYRFYHDEETQDGEYIVLEGLAEIDGLRLPAQRAWYKFEQDEFLGTDIISQGAFD